jgi:hypothetical protein
MVKKSLFVSDAVVQSIITLLSWFFARIIVKSTGKVILPVSQLVPPQVALVLPNHASWMGPLQVRTVNGPNEYIVVVAIDDLHALLTKVLLGHEIEISTLLSPPEVDITDTKKVYVEVPFPLLVMTDENAVTWPQFGALLAP